MKPLDSSDKKKFWNVNFYISHMQCALRSEFRLIVISAIINRRLMTCALTFFLMIFFSNSGEPLMKFSFTNSSSFTSWSFWNPSSQKKKTNQFLKHDIFHVVNTSLWIYPAASHHSLTLPLRMYHERDLCNSAQRSSKQDQF